MNNFFPLSNSRLPGVEYENRKTFSCRKLPQVWCRVLPRGVHPCLPVSSCSAYVFFFDVFGTVTVLPMKACHPSDRKCGVGLVLEQNAFANSVVIKQVHVNPTTFVLPSGRVCLVWGRAMLMSSFLALYTIWCQEDHATRVQIA